MAERGYQMDKALETPSLLKFEDTRQSLNFKDRTPRLTDSVGKSQSLLGSGSKDQNKSEGKRIFGYSQEFVDQLERQ